MNTTKQFWALLRFQARVSWFLWFMALAFGTPLILSFLMPASYIPSLSSLLTVQNLFFVGLMGVWVIAPEMAQFGSASSAWSAGTEFVLTRAIDRRVLYRARAVLLYVLVLALPLASLLHSIGQPDLKLREYLKVEQQECLNRVPGATLVPDPEGGKRAVISIPHGSVLIEAWRLWLFIVTALIVQALLLFLYPIKQRIIIFYALFVAFSFAPAILILRHIGKDTPTGMETTFFAFAGHPAEFCLLTALALVVCELWCERRFASLEQ